MRAVQGHSGFHRFLLLPPFWFETLRASAGWAFAWEKKETLVSVRELNVSYAHQLKRSEVQARERSGLFITKLNQLHERLTMTRLEVLFLSREQGKGLLKRTTKMGETVAGAKVWVKYVCQAQRIFPARLCDTTIRWRAVSVEQW